MALYRVAFLSYRVAFYRVAFDPIGWRSYLARVAAAAGLSLATFDSGIPGTTLIR